jgi:hypothetical protein
MSSSIAAMVFAVALALTGPLAPEAGVKNRPGQRVVQTKSEQGPATGAPDENIADDTDLNARKALDSFPKPPEKGGAQKRGAYCGVYVDNYTPYTVKVYVDGALRGAVGPWGGLWLATISGPTKLYSKASFDDGTTLTWRNTLPCEGNRRYSWRLQE